MGFHIFEQVAGKIKPTSEGQVYLEHARQILGIDAALMEHLEKIRIHKSGVVRVGVSTTRSAYVLPNILYACKESYPDIEVKILEGISKELEEMAYHREVDFILSNLPFQKYPLQYKELFEEQAVLVVPAQFELCEKAQPRSGYKYPWIDVKSLEQVPITLLKPGQRLREIVDSLFLVAGMIPTTFLETQNAETAFALAEKGLSTCLIYDSYFTARPSMQVMPFSVGEAPICHQYVAAYPSDAQLSTSAQVIMETIISCAKEYGLKMGPN